MTDLERILPLWHELESSGVDYVLATVVAVEGSSYRKPGARMLLAADGRRAGTVSGGCLEAEVAQRAWWLTSKGPVVERYSTAEEDGERPYGSGCGGVVYLLLERRQTASRLLNALVAAFHERKPLAITTVLEGPQIGRRAFAGLPKASPEALSIDAVKNCADCAELHDLAAQAFQQRTSIDRNILLNRVPTRVFADYRPARPGLWIFGAGDDARPLLHLARELGWFVAVADGRSHLTTRDRFTQADVVLTLPIDDLPGVAAEHFDVHRTDAAVVMTHSFDQDAHIVASLLDDSFDLPLAYLGVLGPQRRTREVLAEAARLRNLAATTDRIERWLEQLHAPTGLDLGAETPATVALSILAEIQQVLTAASAAPLRQVRASKVAATQV